MNIFEINKTKLWPAFDKFMRLGGHTKVGAGTYKRGERVYRFDKDGNMNSNLYGRWKVFLHKYLDGGIEYIESMS